MTDKQMEHCGKINKKKKHTDFQLTKSESEVMLKRKISNTGLNTRQHSFESCKFHALSIWRKRTGAFLVQVRTLDRTGPLLWVQV